MNPLRRGCLAAALYCIALACIAGDGSVKEVGLDALSPLAASDVLTSRLLSPMTQLRIARYLDDARSGLAAQSIKAGDETFDLFVPTQEGEHGYGLLVYVWPGDGMAMPVSWRRQFEARHLIFIAAHRSGNDENVWNRRLPLGLHGLDYARRHFRIDPDRVYVGGFSGGSRMAEKLALGYPDVFRGLFLAGGSDALGTAGFVPPDRERMRMFQRRMRIVFATGTQDLPNRTKDARTRASFTDVCVRGMQEASPARSGHWIPENRDMERVLQLLEQPVTDPDAAYADCEARLDATIRQRVEAVQRLHDEGRDDDARKALDDIDGYYGGLAMPDVQRLSEMLYPVLRPQAPAASGGGDG